MQVTHIVTDSGDLSRWLQKGGEFRAKLNGIGFALPVDITLDDKHQLQGCKLSKHYAFTAGKKKR